MSTKIVTPKIKPILGLSNNLLNSWTKKIKLKNSFANHSAASEIL